MSKTFADLIEYLNARIINETRFADDANRTPESEEIAASAYGRVDAYEEILNKIEELTNVKD